MNQFFYYLLPFFIIGIAFAEGSDPRETSVGPAHSSQINNHPVVSGSPNEQSESLKSSLYLQFNINGLYSSLSDWKTQNRQTDGSIPSTQSFVFGGEVGCVINKYIQVGLGYEYFFTTKISTLQATGDQINSTFFYGSLTAEMPLESIPNLSLFAGLDIGSLSATEVLENYGGLDFNRSGSTTGYRLLLGAQYFIQDNWSIMASGGYLFGKVTTVTVNGQTWPHYSLDLSGFVLRFAVNYHFQLF